MRFSLFIIAALIISNASAALAQLPTPAPAGPQAPPSVEQLKELLAQEKYQDVLRGVARCMSLKGPAAQSYDKYDLYMLRGEAYVHTRANPPAAEAFAAAQKETTDPARRDLARAGELLLRASKSQGYVTKGSPTTRPAVMPIVQPADRKAAFAALLADLHVASDRTLAAGAKAETLPPVLDAARAAVDIAAVEFAAAGNNDQTRAAAAQLGQRAHTLIHDATDRMRIRSDEIWNWATTQIWLNNDRGEKIKFQNYQGLDPAGERDLHEMVTTCAKIVAVAGDLAKATGNEQLKADGERARKLGARAETILNIRWRYGDASLPQLPAVD